MEATAEEDIHQTAEAATETAAVAMASAEATVTTPKAEREDLHLTDRAVLLTGTGRLTDREEAMAATTTREARGPSILWTKKKLRRQPGRRREKAVIFKKTGRRPRIRP